MVENKVHLKENLQIQKPGKLPLETRPIRSSTYAQEEIYEQIHTSHIYRCLYFILNNDLYIDRLYVNLLYFRSFLNVIVYSGNDYNLQVKKKEGVMRSISG